MKGGIECDLCTKMANYKKYTHVHKRRSLMRHCQEDHNVIAGTNNGLMAVELV